MANKKRLDEVIQHIKAHPETWDQGVYHSPCGTAHCLAGHAQIFAGLDPSANHAKEDATTWLGLKLIEGCFLFNGRRTIQDFEDFRDGKLELSWGESLTVRHRRIDEVTK